MRWVPTGRRWAGGLFALVAVGLVAAGIAVALRRPKDKAPPPSPAATPAPTAAATTVTLPEEKAKAAGLRVEAVGTASLPVEVVVPGRIEADVDRRIDVRPRVSGIVRTIAVVLGQKVKAGDLLVMLDSADVGTARLNLRSRQRDLAIARDEARWRSQVATNVDELIPALRKSVPAAALEKQFAAKPLGTDRALLLSSYADWQIAVHEEEKQTDLYRQKIVGEHMASLALHTREGSQAKFEAALEQVRYDADRQRRIADQQARLAESAATDAAVRLRMLGVPVDPAESVAHPEKVLDAPADADALTACPIVAPFDGTIILRAAVPSQRAEPTDVLFTLADLGTVRVMANIPESDFAVLPTLREGAVRVSAAAYPGRAFAAKVLDVGAQVDPTTRTVTLLAETPNPDGLLKLGMFARVAMDSARAESAVVVPDGTVVEIDGKPVVFVSDRDGRTFVARAVTLGRAVDGRQAIAAGLKPGERVATAGAVALKGELILQNQAGGE